MLASCGVIFAVACACIAGGGNATTDHFTIHQAGLVPAPSGPHAAGPLVPYHRLAIEGAASATTVTPIGETRSAGANGQIVPRAVVRARIAYGVLERLELGADVEFASGAWGVSLPSDLAGDVLGPALFVRSGVQMRVILVGTRGSAWA
jgi:hypothetical protein